MENVASIECNLGGGQNGYIDLILLPKQYDRLYDTAFVLPPDPGQTAHVPTYTPPTEEKRIIRENAEQQRLYDEYMTVDSALKKNLLAVFDNPYLATLNNEYTCYDTSSTMNLIKHLYKH